MTSAENKIFLHISYQVYLILIKDNEYYLHLRYNFWALELSDGIGNRILRDMVVPIG